LTIHHPPSSGRYANNLHSLNLSTLPLTHPTLRKSRMVKNARFESVVELYHDKKSGSGQHYVDTIATMLGLGTGMDIGLLRNIALLPTFDTFSVRLLLRDIGLPFGEEESLPPDVSRAVELQMRKFTIPLLRYVYHGQTHEGADLQHLVLLFRDPDVKRAEAHLKRLAAKLNIPLPQVPRFLEDYSDTFLAISLYQYTFLNIKPSVEAFLEALTRLKTHFQKNQVILQSLDRVQADFTHIMKSTAKRLNASEQLVSLLWGENLNASLETLQPRIREFQFLLGYLLCGISVKIAAWTTAFPSPQAGTPKKCIELITSDIVFALGQLRTAAESGLPRRKMMAGAGGMPSLQAFLRSF
jgi:hypothetical protein